LIALRRPNEIHVACTITFTPLMNVTHRQKQTCTQTGTATARHTIATTTHVIRLMAFCRSVIRITTDNIQARNAYILSSCTVSWRYNKSILINISHCSVSV